MVIEKLAKARMMGRRTRNHSLLGRVNWIAQLQCWESKIDLLLGCPVRFLMIVEADWADADPRVIFEAAANYFVWSRRAEPKCRKRIADDLLDTYNRMWAGCDSVEGPLTRKQFIAHLKPCDITLYHDGSSVWMYESGPLFAGHVIELYIDADRKFAREAGLFG